MDQIRLAAWRATTSALRPLLQMPAARPLGHQLHLLAASDYPALTDGHWSPFKVQCAECDFTAKWLEHVKRHVKMKDEGATSKSRTRTCNICEYAATRPSHPKKQRERVHNVM